MGAALVTLQRPLPVIPILRPTIFIFSMMRTEAPICAARTPAIRPAAPPPMTIIRFIFTLI